MDIFETIKSKIQIQDLLDRMWIKYNNSKRIYDEWKYSDSYNFSVKDNIVKNHNPAKDYRAEWNPYNFYVTKTWCDTKSALEFFEKEFWIVADKDFKPDKKIEPFVVITDKQRLVSYLYLRWIDYSRLPEWYLNLTCEKVYWKNAPQWDVLCMQAPMYDEKMTITWYQSRSLIWKWFKSNWNDWYFMHFTPNIKQDFIFIVEWLSDFLSLRQFTEQVIWFKSASTPPSDWIIAFINKFKKVYLLFDNDKAGKEAKEKFKEKIDANVYEIDEADDINDIVKDSWEDILELIPWASKQTMQKAFQHISYAEWLKMWLDELLARQKASVISYWFQKFDECLWYMLPWQLIVIWWVAWVGKSTIVNQIANNVARQWFMVCRYSLEDRLQENRINELYYQVVYLRTNRWQSYPPHYIFEANLATEQEYPWIQQDIQQAAVNLWNYNKNVIDLFHNRMIGITELENLFKDVVINKWVKLVVIDHLHYVKFDKNDRHDLAIETFMHQLNDLLRRYNVTCILVSHYRKLNKDKNNQEQDPDNDSFKDWAAIAQVANKVIHIARDLTETQEWKEWDWRAIRYIVTKNRWKSRLWTISAMFINWRINMAESSLSRERRPVRKTWY